jgi:predicted nucleotidyltransferase
MSTKRYTTYAKLLKKHLPELQKQFSVKSLGIFGSYVRGQQREDSDLDVLVNFEETPSMLKFISLEDRLSELTGVQIDLVMEDSLRPNIGKRILQEVVRL